ncbi:BON domain-containing protein [Pseudanabaena mucicola]|uniref:BON domain-containing protein n=1 Tax=Pseudanabaena mucicola FACHB-723 TaxID=2692860 RepID=A0ABR7ZZZ5_9CYAN|nr:BON domain-containing protein [Pseudanabaena mucicola]MBD2189561.1 BON domain-containing protein [Pseudanabaena mucicola FACHB-723]
MSEQQSNFPNQSLNDVEKFLLLLSDLNIINAEKPQSPQNQQRIDISELLNIDNNEQSLSTQVRQKSPDEDFSDITRSPSVYPFPSLLDELPFLRDIPSTKNGFDHDVKKPQIAEQAKENLDLTDNTKYARSEQIEPSKKEEIEAVSLLQEILLSSGKAQISPQIAQGDSLPSSQSLSAPNSRSPFQSQSQSPYLENSSDDDALHLLQDILVVPEIEDLRSFKIAVEQKLGIVESQVNNPEIMNKIEGLESLLHSASRRLSAIDDEKSNIPMEIEEVRERIAQLENQINQPAELVQLLLPIIAELLSLKADQAREEMCQAITPIIAEVIFERSQLDRVSMSHAIADILPNAISEQIRNNPEQIAKAIGPEVGAAIREQIRLDRDAIIDALAPEMGSAIKRQIHLERDAMVDALYPVIGNTIAKYFAEAIRSINEKVEQTFSVEGIQRKFRARMKGVSEAELILKESVPFEIQAIFLIHNLSGLVMIDIQKSDLDALVEPIDSDMLAGMLTAIRSFANECMSRSESTTELDAINYSGSKIVLEVAGYCYLAVIIRGEPDMKIINKIRDIFGQIIQVYGEQLKEFDGDPSLVPMEAEISLKTLMEIMPHPSAKKSPKTLLFMSLGLLTLIALPIGFWQYQSHREQRLEAQVLEAFASTPELAVYKLHVEANGERLQLSGKLPNQYLRNRALQVASEATNTQIAIANINNNIHAVNVPPDPELVAIEIQRLTKALNYTQGINIQTQFKDGQVSITGQIEQPRMIPKITQAFAKVAGIKTVSNATTILTPQLATRIYFPFGITELQPNDVEKLIEVQAFLEMYPDYNIKILAKNDSISDRTINNQLGIKRAQNIREALIRRGVKAQRLQISGIMDKAIQQSSDQMLRWVEFQPVLKPMSLPN